MEESGNLLENVDRRLRVSAPVLVALKFLMTALPIAQIAIGAVYLNDCPQQRYIPIYLLVSGAFGVLLGLISCLPCIRAQDDRGWTVVRKLSTIVNTLLTAFLFCWFITGNVWVYTMYPANYNQTIPGLAYCDKTVYRFAFWSTTVVYILVGALMIGCTGVVIFFWMYGKRDTIGGFNWNV